MRTLIQEASNIIINEVLPRAKKGGKFPHPKALALFTELKNSGVINTIKLRQLLDIEMFHEDTEQNREEFKVYLKSNFGVVI